jgi:signal transduction histidine kinase
MSLSAGARAEQILVRTFALFRLAGMAQVLLALALAVPRASHVPGVGALAAAVLAESGVLVVACWRRNRIPGGWVVGDVAATAAALVAGAWLTGPAAYNTWANFMYPFSLIEILIAGLGLASLPEVILAAAGLAAVYASSAVVIHGDPLWNVVPNAVSYLGNAVVSWLIATELRRSARLLDDQRRLAVSQAEELARAREREHSARLLHDRVLQTLEMLAHPSWIPDEALRRQVAAEASWLRRFV